PATNAACSGLNGDNPRAISSAFTNSSISRPWGTSNCAAVVFPAPLGPPMMTISSTCSEVPSSDCRLAHQARQRLAKEGEADPCLSMGYGTISRHQIGFTVANIKTKPNMGKRLMRQWRIVLPLLAGSLAAPATGLIITPLAAEDRTQARSMVISQYGIVGAEQPIAARAGTAVLERGGNAVDAAVAANAAMGLVAPMMSGIGGDLFAIVYDAGTNKVYGLNASGWAPKELTPE